MPRLKVLPLREEEKKQQILPAVHECSREKVSLNGAVYSVPGKLTLTGGLALLLEAYAFAEVRT